jgi:DnaJ-class molecular chaperone
MTLEEARQLLGLGPEATRKEIRAAFRRAARHWHPDRAPAGEEAVSRARMQEVNAAYQRLQKFMENYRYRLVEAAEAPSYQEWWHSRFSTGVWGPPPPKGGGREGD